MRRQNSNLNEDVILFIGESDVLTLNSTHQIALVTRTLLLKEDVLLTYHNPIGSVRESRLSRSRAPITLDKLTNHQHEYKISVGMRVRLLLGRRDEGVDAYFKELRIDRPQQGSSIVAVIHTDQNFMHGFVFKEEQCALDFYESMNAAIATQIYVQELPSSIPFNAKIVNMLGETLNGRCCINPDDFGQGRQEEDEVRFVLDFLKRLEGEFSVNFRGQLVELQLRFRIIDETSRDYAVQFLEVLPERVQRLVIAGCKLDSNMLSQLLAAPSLTDKFTRMQELNLSKNSLNDDAFATLTKLLKSCRMLRGLNLNENSVSFEKEAIIVAFLQSITYFQLNLQLASNCIQSARHITNYLINAEGTLPLSELDISFNPIAPEELNNLTKAYLAKAKQEAYSFRLHLNQLQFQEAHSFHFLKEQYRARRPHSMAIPMTITKHLIRRKGKDIGSTEQQLSKAANIEDLFRNYAIEVFRGNFFRLKQIRAELRGLGVSEEVIQAEVHKHSQQKKIQEQMIVKKVQNCLDFGLQAKEIISELNQTIIFCRRKGLSGTAFNFLACIKRRVEEKVVKEMEDGNLGRAYRQSLYSQSGRYKVFYERFFRDDYVFHVNLVSLLPMTDQQLLKEQMSSGICENMTVFLTFQYLLTERPQKHHLFVLQACLADPRLSSLKIARFEVHNIIKIFHKNRVNKYFLTLPSVPEERASFLNIYGIETYKFSETFIESGVSSSSYVGMLSRGRVEGEQQRQVLAFIEISKNFLKYLYYTPQQLSEQTLIYLNSITTHLSNLQNSQENELKLVLAEELLLHMMTFFDSSRYMPLKSGLLTSIAEFIARRVALPEQLLKRFAAHVIKAEGDIGLQLHVPVESEPWEGKADWRITDLPILGGLLMGRGRFQVRVADAAHPQLLLSVDADQLDTVLDLWGRVKGKVEQLNEITNISAANIDYYWLCGGKGDGQPGAICYLPSYQHIGKLIFDDCFDRFYLRRVLYSPQEHSLEYLAHLKYEQLLAIFQQAKESLKLAASLFLSPQTTIQAIILTIWTDILLTDELMLGELRKKEDEESQGRYAMEREKVVGECMAKLYNRYVPVGFALDQVNRNKVIFQTKSKQMAGVPKNFNEAIKTAILDLLKIAGITAFTTVLPSAVHPYTLYINNHNILFEDRSKGERKILSTKFRDIVEFDLTADGDCPILRFEVMEVGERETLCLHSFSIKGDSQWIGQCFSLISQVARNRLAYPPQLLFACEDETSCFSECPVKGEFHHLLVFPLMDIDRYFSFILSRREETVSEALLPPSDPPPKISQKAVNDITDSLPQNIPPQQRIDNKVEAVHSLGVIGERDPQLQAIVKSVQQVQQVVTSRRSSIKCKEVINRRRSNRSNNR